MHLSQLPSQLLNSLALCAKKKSKNKIYIRCLRKERQMCREKKWWHTHARTLFPFPLICRTISGSSLLQPPNKRRGSLVPKGPQQTCRPKKKTQSETRSSDKYAASSSKFVYRHYKRLVNTQSLKQQKKKRFSTDRQERMHRKHNRIATQPSQLLA